MSGKPSIDPKPDGPLALTGEVEFVTSDGQVAAPEAARYLCRCGLSKTKPYCDGSHKDAGFSSENTGTPRDKLIAYEGAEVTVHYSPYLCSHAAECNKRLASVFNSKEKPWIQPDKGSVEAIWDVVRACPSGALQASVAGAGPQHRAGDAPKVAVEKNGPYRVEAVSLEGADFSQHATAQKYVLCRCGHSKNKPFCDGSHSGSGWTDD